MLAQDYAVTLQVKTNITSDDFPSLCSNKDWDGADVIDLISTSNMGHTLKAGVMEGWTIFMQPNGAWGWNIGDGKYRLDYLPTNLQRINDGKLHEIAISFYLDKKTAWLYFDGRHVAIYSLAELKLTANSITKNLSFSENSKFKIKNEKAGKFSQTTDDIEGNYSMKGKKSDSHYLQEKPQKLETGLRTPKLVFLRNPKSKNR